MARDYGEGQQVTNSLHESEECTAVAAAFPLYYCMGL